MELRTRATTAAIAANAKLVPGPASETASMSRRPLRSRDGFTGTGLAQPMTGTPASAPKMGTTIGAERVDVRYRVEREPAGALRGVVTEDQRDTP